MKRSSASRTPASNLSESVHQQLTRSAALIAAVIVLALAHPAGAKIVYTPTNRDLLKGRFDLDLKNNGKVDFTFTGSFTSTGCGEFGNAITASLTVVPISGNGYEGRKAARLGMGSPIGADQKFFAAAAQMASVIRHCAQVPTFTGNWVVPGMADGYLGLKFKIRGKDHYGWAQIKTNFRIGRICWFSAMLTGYAYETTAGKSIKAGQIKGVADLSDGEGFGNLSSVISPIFESPQFASLGMLDFGAQGVPLQRRKQSVANMSGNNGVGLSQKEKL